MLISLNRHPSSSATGTNSSSEEKHSDTELKEAQGSSINLSSESQQYQQDHLVNENKSSGSLEEHISALEAWRPTLIEQEHVHAFYEDIAEHVLPSNLFFFSVILFCFRSV
jgi:hypothetical protein